MRPSSALRRQARLASIVLLGWLGAGCTGPRLEVTSRATVATDLEKELSEAGALATLAKTTLRHEGLHASFRDRPDEAIRTLAQRYQEQPTAERRQALAEMCADTGQRLAAPSPLAAAGHFLDAMRLTARAARADATAGRVSADRALYDQCAAGVAQSMQAQAGETVTAPGPLRTYQLGLAQGREFADPRHFDLLVPTSHLQLRNIDLKPVRQEGFGAAMVGHLLHTAERKEADPLMTKAGYSLPLNATVRFSGARAELALQDLSVKGRAAIEGREVALAGDFTAALAFVYYEGRLDMDALLSLIRPAKLEGKTGLFALAPFRTDKIPLILVHGLASSAERWLPFMNVLSGDPEIRERYQLLLFNYPSGNPIGRNATSLRMALAEFRARYDPDQIHPNLRRSVILGHSMGGILSNTQIRNSGDRIERLLLRRPIEELPLGTSERDELAQMMTFEASPDITRAVFVAAPHRGSPTASAFLGNLGAWLIRLPFDLADQLLGELVLIGELTGAAQSILGRPTNSVTSLRPDNPILPAILDLPVRNGVAMHSIIAQEDPADPLLESSDGIVFYTSAHLAEAASEVVVPGANHNSVTSHEIFLREVRRILRLHAGVK